MSSHLSIVELNGLRYYVQVTRHADQDAPALLLLHGFTGSHDSWSGVLPQFAEHFTVIAPDLIGHGDTQTPDNASRASIENAAADLITLLNQLDVQQAHLLGYSMGGRLALYTAFAHPTRIGRLILESASPGLATEEERAVRRTGDEALATRIERDGLAAFVNEWAQLPLFRSQEQLASETRATLRAQRLATNTMNGLRTSLRGMGTGSQPSLWGRLGELTCPTLLIAGALDEKYTTINQAMATYMPQAETAILPNAGHTVHLEQPAAFLSHTLRFLL